MKHPAWERREQDRAFQRGVSERMRAPVLMLIPLLVFAGFVYGELGSIPSQAVIFTSLAYSLVFFWSLSSARKDTLRAMGEDPPVTKGYQPPEL